MNFSSKLTDLFFPKSCVDCSVFENTFLCEVCRSKLKEIQPESFISRKRSMSWMIEDENKKFTNLEKVFYFYEYNDVIHSLIEEIKYKSHRDVISEFVNLIFEAKESKRIDFNQFDLLTYIPTHEKKLAQRRFNHSELIVDEVSKRLNIPYLRILDKVKNTKAQADLSREKRLENLKNSFQVRSNLPIELKDQRILIIDDICTTGSTLNEAAKEIKQYFPETKIFGLALSRGD